MSRVATTSITFVLLAVLGPLSPGGAGESRAADLGRLFYTPEQRADLEAARARGTRPARPATRGAAAPVRFDGVVIRSDGHSTSWVNGKPQPGTSGAGGLKPGQVRAAGKVYEPYQLLPPIPEAPANEVPAP